ncbi:glycosyltransferase family 2 protein [Terrimonas alba]|uniref:glycosyltransferase family 2 protein n=1 Tax=Terrimonas alba TaxID=3349636 RepID=UPI0035F49133
MKSSVEISICIPAYKNVVFLDRLLDSIQAQTFKNYEIVITDDSPDDAVELLVGKKSFKQEIKYFRNRPALGTPENWNEAIRHASGEWIKLMHNDDWFTDKDSLQTFYNNAKAKPECSFFFSAFQNITEKTGASQKVKCSFLDLAFLKMSPLHLFKKVYVGNPSCTMIRNNIDLFYDNRFKFVVDFEYYIRCLRKVKYAYIDDILISVGFHEEQVTKYTFLVPEVQIPENFILLEKLGIKILSNPFVYDYYWRLFRNLKMRSEENVQAYWTGDIPMPLSKMIIAQSKVSPGALRSGILSKLYMFCNYILHLLG